MTRYLHTMIRVTDPEATITPTSTRIDVARAYAITRIGWIRQQQEQLRLQARELVKKPRDLLEYVIVHEMVHISEPTHSPRFFALLSEHYPSWPEARRELNELPVPQLTGS